MNRRKLLSYSSAAFLAAGAPGLLQPRMGWCREENSIVEEASFTKESQRAVQKGMDWLRKVVNPDGGYGVDVSQPSDIGCSCMVGLAMMADGVTPLEGERQRDLRNIRSYILKIVDNMPSDDVTSQQGSQLQNKIGRNAHTFFTALFLSQVMGEGTQTEPVKAALQNVVNTIVKTQTSKGDWGSQSWAPVLGTVMGWVSLRAANTVGITVGGAPEKTAEFLLKSMKQNLGNNQGWMHELYKNATGIRVLYSMQMEDEPIAKKAFEKVKKLVNGDNTPFSQAGGEEYLAFHLITETMLKRGGEDWNSWFPVVRDKIIKVQNRDGSWTGHHCITSRTFCTAAAILVLTSPYRYLPISQA